MKTLENQTRYKCEFCPKEYKQARFLPGHEAKCSKNPDNQHACFDCVHLTQETTLGYHDGLCGEYTTEYTTFYCEAQKGQDGDEFQELYSYKLKGKGVLEDMPKAILMPNTCSLQKTEWWKEEE